MRPQYKTTSHATHDGAATFCVAYLKTGSGYQQIGETRRFKTYPAAVRARKAAHGICKRHRTKFYKGAQIDISDL